MASFHPDRSESAAPPDVSAGDASGGPTPVHASDGYETVILATAPSPASGARVGALDMSVIPLRGWGVMALGLLGTLLIAASYVMGWVSATLEHFGVADTESLSLDQVTSPSLAWMYRIATLGLIACAVGLVFAPRPVRPLLRLAGLSAAGLSLLSTVIATLTITTVVARGSRYFGGAETVVYGWGLFSSYLGIAALMIYVISFRLLDRGRRA